MKFAVIGLGFFGSALARELAESGHEVLAIDTDEAHIRELRDTVTMAAIADGTDAGALEQLGVGGMDTVIVAVGEGFEASLMITSHCQKLKVPRVYTRVINQVHEHLLDLMGVTGKIHAESLAAAYFARQVTHESVRRYFGIDEEHGIVEMEMPEGLAGKTLAEIELRKRHRLNLVTVRRPADRKAAAEAGEENYRVTGTPGPDFRLEEGDRLIVFGRLKDISEFCGG
jgi:trk system potassium uptake protein TrkA